VTPAAEARVSTRALALLFALALVLRLALVFDYTRHHPYADRPVIDEASYDRWANEIAAGDWIGDEVFFQEPLYPYWLASIYALWGTGDGEAGAHDGQRAAARCAQALFGAGAVVVLTAVAARLFGRRAGLVAGFALATYRPLIYFPALLLKANLFIPLLCLLAWLALRLGRREREGAGARRAGFLPWMLVGVLAGLGALLRGNLLLLLPAFALLPLARVRARPELPRALLRAGAALAGMACVLLPVALRNFAVGGVFALTTSGAGTNLYGGNNPDNPLGRATEFDWVRGIPEHEADDWRHEAERRSGRVLDPGEVSSFWVDETLASVRREPLTHARILWNKLRLALGAYEVPDNHHIEWDARHVSMLRLPLPGYGLWGMLGLAGMLLYGARRWLGAPEAVDKRGAAELAVFYLLYLATIVLTVMSERARLPLVPMLLAFAGYWVDAALARPRRPLWLLPLALAALLVHWPVLGADERAEDLLKRDYNYAVVLLQEQKLSAARPIIAGLEAERPGTVSVALLGAELAFRSGLELKLAGAPAAEVEAELDRALELARPVATGTAAPPRDRFRAQKLAGLVCFEAGNYPAAERRFREALEFDPTDPEAGLRLANILWMRAGTLEGEARKGALAEARALLARLAARDPSPLFAERLAEVEAALAEQP
jgi:4-amino-4-deoxy-L-arabinose transferase-like glycosyltransferase